MMDKMTGPVSKLDTDIVSELFPQFDANCLQRKNTHVDVLLGCDYFGLHPKKEEAKSGQNLSVISGELGVGLQSTHPSLREKTVLDSNLAKAVHNSVIKTDVKHVVTSDHFEFHPPVVDASGGEDSRQQLFVNITSSLVRIVFNSSQVFQGVSLNSYLTKGPDSYMNNLLEILL